jgi:hypothetical protein
MKIGVLMITSRSLEFMQMSFDEILPTVNDCVKEIL